jgi:hypothetical protein
MIQKTYKAEDYIGLVSDTEGHINARGQYKYFVWNEAKTHPTHHTNSVEDAVWWFDECVKKWLA